MKVYVTFQKDGYGGEQIEKVFAAKADAQDHIITTKFRRNMVYAGMGRHELEEKALGYIEEHEVIEAEEVCSNYRKPGYCQCCKY